MIFGCGSCGARYQLPDEKVAGRRLRYRCRKCGQEILLDGVAGTALDVASRPSMPPDPAVVPASFVPSPNDQLTVPRAALPQSPHDQLTVPRAALPSAPPARVSALPQPRSVAPGSVPPPAPRPRSVPPPALAAPTAAPAPVQAPSVLPEVPVWFVVIGGAPSGPMTRSSLEHEVRSRGLDASTLVYRDGLRAWCALGTVPDLASLLPALAQPAPLPPVEPPSSDEHTLIAASPFDFTRGEVPRAPRVPAELMDSGSDEATAFVAPPRAEPAARSVPPAAHPTPTTHEAADPSAARRPLSIAPTDAGAPRRRRSSWLAPLLVLAGIGVGVGLTLVLMQPRGEPGVSGGPAESTASPARSGSPGEPTAADAPAAAAGAGAAIDLADVAEVAEVAEVDEPGEAAPTASAQAASGDAAHEQPSGASAGSTSGDRAAHGARAAAASDEALPMPSGAPVGAAPTAGATRPSTSTPPPAGDGPLEPSAISAVVRQNRGRAQICYERAATLAGSAPDMRLVVDLTIGRDGRVTDATATGNDFGGVAACVERTVRTFRFPASSTGGRTQFSLVFAGG